MSTTSTPTTATLPLTLTIPPSIPRHRYTGQQHLNSLLTRTIATRKASEDKAFLLTHVNPSEIKIDGDLAKRIKQHDKQSVLFALTGLYHGITTGELFALLREKLRDAGLLPSACMMAMAVDVCLDNSDSEIEPDFCVRRFRRCEHGHDGEYGMMVEIGDSQLSGELKDKALKWMFESEARPPLVLTVNLRKRGMDLTLWASSDGEPPEEMLDSVSIVRGRHAEAFAGSCLTIPVNRMGDDCRPAEIVLGKRELEEMASVVWEWGNV